ncbi:hypothetical protein C8J57DRAFT_1534124 [Mycena rebaudengoi]|nr:hypothetical protein C8J57DRAFT_1534124 [Mycena rebaudengoi]
MTSCRPIAHLPTRRRLFIRVHHAPALHASSSTITPEPGRLPVPPPRSSMASSSATLTLTIKSLRPPAQYSLAVHPTDSIAYPAAPLADTQRLLLKGTALADNKLVTESSVKDGDAVNLLVKPRTPQSEPQHGCACRERPPAHPQRGPQPSPSVEAPPGDLPSSSGSSSPSTRSRQNSTTRDITLTLDNATPVLAEQEHSTYHAGIANPSSGRACSRIWGATSLPPADAQLALEEFLRAAKSTLIASEIARVRDQAGVTGMGVFYGAPVAAAPAPRSLAFSDRSSMACSNIAHAIDLLVWLVLLPEFCLFRNFVA